jgi:fumarate reductase subunit C
MAREFTSIPIAIWMAWFLVEIAGLKNGPAGYHPHLSTAFIVFSGVCFLFALLHTVTFLSYSGLIMRIPLGSRHVPAALVSGASFGLFIAASALIALLLIWFGR